MFVLTGMHRSGTSFLSQAAVALGADFGAHEEFFSADKHNENGYFENKYYIGLNNKLLLGKQAELKYWTAPQEELWKRIYYSLISGKWKYITFPGPKVVEKNFPLQKDEMTALADRFKGKWVKDPRLTITMDAWRKVSDIEGIVFSYRNAAAVARSVNKREAVPTGLAKKLWRYHVENFIEQIPDDCPVLLIDFDRFFAEETAELEFERLRAFLGQFMTTNAAARLQDVLDRDLQHHKPVIPDLSSREGIIYDALTQAREHFAGEPSQYLGKQVREKIQDVIASHRSA